MNFFLFVVQNIKIKNKNYNDRNQKKENKIKIGRTILQYVRTIRRLEYSVHTNITTVYTYMYMKKCHWLCVGPHGWYNTVARTRDVCQGR